MMCAPLDVPRQAPVATRAAPADATCGACGHKRQNKDGKTHFFSQCKLVLGRIQCRAALPENHKFYTGAPCGNNKCACKSP